MQLIYYPDPGLSEECVGTGSSNTQDRRKLAAEMFGVMKKNNGVGLAAPQVGLDIRMFVWSENNFGHSIWSPSLVHLSGEVQSTEGCLSLPGVSTTITRETSCLMIGFGMNGKPLKFIGHADSTRIWQHEIDHLNGKLIIDNMTPNEVSANKIALRALLKTATT